MIPALWFSRHEPTSEQLNDILNMGMHLEDLKKGLKLGNFPITTEADVRTVIDNLRDYNLEHTARNIFGVFPPVLMQEMWLKKDMDLPSLNCYSSWNVSRAPVDGAPSFTHKKWVLVGRLSVY